MDRSEDFYNVFFPESVVREAVAVMEERTGEKAYWGYPTSATGRVELGYDSEIEFFSDFGPSLDTFSISAEVLTVSEGSMSADQRLTLQVSYFKSMNKWTISVHAEKRDDLFATFAPFKNAEDKYQLPAPPPPPQPPLKIFIGHGRSQHWRELKDALHHHHGYEVETFETKPRAGQTIPDVIESMARGNTMALMLLTAEDEQLDGSVRARENVVHEVGYCQGRFGREKAILIMEEGVNEFSNVHGIIHIPYKNIREVVGDVLAIIKREFPHLNGGW